MDSAHSLASGVLRMSGKRVRRTRRTWPSFLVVVVALAAVVALLGWWVTRLVTADDVVPSADAPAASDGTSGGSTGDADADGTDGASGTGSDLGSEAGALLEQCATELASVEDAVAAARPGVASWRAHTQARTDWLADRISAKRMDARYERTKQAGQAAQPRFTEAVAAVEEPRSCEGLRSVEEASSEERATGCVERSEAAGEALEAARRTMDEWGDHLRHMDEYADGGMSTGRAMKLWVTAWRKAPEGIEAYEDRGAALRDAPACTAG